MTTHTYRAGLRYDAIDAHNFHETQETSMTTTPNLSPADRARLITTARLIYDPDTHTHLDGAPVLSKADRDAMRAHVARVDGDVLAEHERDIFVAGVYLGACRRESRRNPARMDNAERDDSRCTSAEQDSVKELLSTGGTANLRAAMDLIRAALARGGHDYMGKPQGGSATTHAFAPGVTATMGGPGWGQSGGNTHSPARADARQSARDAKIAANLAGQRRENAARLAGQRGTTIEAELARIDEQTENARADQARREDAASTPTIRDAGRDAMRAITSIASPGKRRRS